MLKPDRQITATDITGFMNEVATRGGHASITSTSASGVALDQSELTLSYVANPSGVKPFGVLSQDVVNKDLTQTHLDPYKNEVQLGSKVCVYTIAEVTTDFVYPGQNPSPGDRAYVGHSGYYANVDVATDDSDLTGATRIVGRFVTGEDEDGFCRIKVNTP